MLLKKETSHRSILCVFDSSTILQSIYDTYTDRLFILFKKGTPYYYRSVGKELYEGFESAASQGAYFAEHIQNNPSVVTRKGMPFDQEEIDGIVERIEGLRKGAADTAA